MYAAWELQTLSCQPQAGAALRSPYFHLRGLEQNISDINYIKTSPVGIGTIMTQFTSIAYLNLKLFRAWQCCKVARTSHGASGKEQQYEELICSGCLYLRHACRQTQRTRSRSVVPCRARLWSEQRRSPEPLIFPTDGSQVFFEWCPAHGKGRTRRDHWSTATATQVTNCCG